MPRLVRVKVLKPIPGHAAGSSLEVAVDSQGVPTSLEWRRRFRDARRDGSLAFPEDDKPRRRRRKEHDER